MFIIKCVQTIRAQVINLHESMKNTSTKLYRECIQFQKKRKKIKETRKKYDIQILKPYQIITIVMILNTMQNSR